MVIEMRTYTTKPGRRADFLKLFRAKSMPAHARIGMKILGPLLSIDNPDVFFWMRGFRDPSVREILIPEFYEGRLWKEELENVLLPMLEKYEVVLVDDPANLIKW